MTHVKGTWVRETRSQVAADVSPEWRPSAVPHGVPLGLEAVVGQLQYIRARDEGRQRRLGAQSGHKGAPLRLEFATSSIGCPARRGARRP